MSYLGSPKSVVIMAMGLILYVILVGLLLFYIEECTVDKYSKVPNGPKKNGFEEITKTCMKVYKSFQMQNPMEKQLNVSLVNCARILAGIPLHKTHINKKKRKHSCRFSTRYFLPWMHSVAFSMTTVGGTKTPKTLGGKILLLLATLFGIFPILRLFIHVGVMMTGAMERLILNFELKILNRSPRMIHKLFMKIVYMHGVALLSYNLLIAFATSRTIFATKWTFVDAFLYWIQVLLTNGHPIKIADKTRFYSSGGWRVLCIDLGMVGNFILLSGFVCAAVMKLHRKVCKAANTIKKSFKRQHPEVYFQIKPIKSHL